MFLTKFRIYGSEWSVNKWTLACKISWIPSLFNYKKWRKWEGTCSLPFNLNFRSTCAFSSDDSDQKQWRTVGQAAETPMDTSLGSTFFSLVLLLLLMVLNWANYFSREMGRGRTFTWPKRGEDNVFHLFQGGTGKQQLATDENKILGNEEIRNTKELELIKINDQSIFGWRGQKKNKTAFL